MIRSDNDSDEFLKTQFLNELYILLHQYDDTIGLPDYDGKTAIDIVLELYGKQFDDQVLLLMLRKWLAT
jgi:hypothetical protein